jgi:N-acetylglucosamine kinase-like BadF-type ATPase
MAPTILVAIDAGGTKTECVALRVEDGVAARAAGPGSNYQGTGIAAAQTTWNHLTTICCEQLGVTSADVVAAGLGIAGLDRPKDRVTIGASFASIWPHGPALELVNDADLALRAGAPGGVGVAVVSGTGCNAMGMAADGGRFRVGGIGPEFGDLGSASDIGIEALRAAFRSQDDRGPATSLVPMIMTRLQLERLDDLVDFFLVDREEDGDGGEFDSGKLAPLVFEAAGQGDAVSIGILEWAGRELGLSARAVARNLFGAADAFPLVLGGSVLQKGATDHLMTALLTDVHTEFPDASPVVLDVPPVAGALLLARDRYVALLGNDDTLTPAAVLESLRGLI